MTRVALYFSIFCWVGLQTILIAAKLFGIVYWNWGIILAPMYIPVGIVGSLAIVGVCYNAICETISKSKARKKSRNSVHNRKDYK